MGHPVLHCAICKWEIGPRPAAQDPENDLKLAHTDCLRARINYRQWRQYILDRKSILDFEEPFTMWFEKDENGHLALYAKAKQKDAPVKNKVTEADIKARLVGEEYILRDQFTICILTLDNGFKVAAGSGCVDPKNFDANLGKKLAFQKAFDQLYALLGFALAEARSKKVAPLAFGNEVRAKAVAVPTGWPEDDDFHDEDEGL